MKEVKQPSKKPLVYYYLVALLILMVLNLTLFPAMLETPVQDVTYDQFMSMTYEQNVGSPPSWWAGSCPCSPSCSSAGSSTDG